MSLLRRALRFTRAHGPAAAAKQTAMILHRFRFIGLQAVYSCDLPLANPIDTKSFTIEQLRRDDPSQTERILRYGGETTVARQFRERFQAGARLYLAKVAGELVAFGWSIQGRTVRPYFFPFSATDVHLFDFVVFPEFRGKGINPQFVRGILANAGSEGARRAYIECDVWNDAQLRSLKRTPFLPLGRARGISFAGFTCSQWSSNHEEPVPRKTLLKRLRFWTNSRPITAASDRASPT